MKTSPCQALLHSALLLSGIATMPAHATGAAMLLGLAAMGGLRRIRRSAPRAW